MRSGPPQIEETTEWTCTICGESTLSRAAAVEHLVSATDSEHCLEVIFQFPRETEDRGRCGQCGKESSLEGVIAHCRDKPGHTPDPPRLVIDSDATATAELPLETATVFHCPKCGTREPTPDAVAEHDCVAFEAAQQRVRSLSGPTESEPTPLAQDHPDVVADRLLRHEGDPVRIFLDENDLTVPTEPYHRGVSTTSVSVASFDAVVEWIHPDEGGMSLIGQLHLPADEWERIGLQQHWEAENASTVGEERILELWASRYDTLEAYEDGEYVLPARIDDDSPIVTSFQEYDHGPDRPVAPFPPIKLDLYVAHAEAADHDVHDLDRLEVGHIRRVEPLPELSQQPEKRNERPDYPDSPPSSPPSRHPSIDYGELDPLPATDEMLDALYTVNRVAKRHDEQGDQAYRAGDGATAKVHSVKKHALYDLKTVALHRLAVRNPDSLTISRHEIDGHDHWLFDFGERSFHQPAEAVAEDLLDDFGLDTDGAAESIEYDPDPGSRDLPMSIENALGVFARFDLDANDFLSQTTVTDYTWNIEQYTGWNISTG